MGSPPTGSATDFLSPAVVIARRAVPGRWRTDHLLRLVQVHHGNVQLSLKTLSATVGVSEQHLGRVFKTSTGLTFRHYLRRVRTEEARRLLADPTFSVKEVAARLGYSASSNFVKDFKLMTGSTPLQYRSRQPALPATP